MPFAPAISIVRALFLHFHLARFLPHAFAPIAKPPLRLPFPPGGAPSENECRGITVHPRLSFLLPPLSLSLSLSRSLSLASRCAFRLIPLSDLTNSTSRLPAFFPRGGSHRYQDSRYRNHPGAPRRFSPFTLPWVTRVKWMTHRGRKIRGFFPLYVVTPRGFYFAQAGSGSSHLRSVRVTYTPGFNGRTMSAASQRKRYDHCFREFTARREYALRETRARAREVSRDPVEKFKLAAALREINKLITEMAKADSRRRALSWRNTCFLYELLVGNLIELGRSGD
jgi:hypothetical protein